MSIFTTLVNLGKEIVRGIGNNKISDIILKTITYVPKIIAEIDEVIKLFKRQHPDESKVTPAELKVVVDDALAAFDAATGTDGVSIFKLKNKENEEYSLDFIIEMIRIVVYDRYDIPYTPRFTRLTEGGDTEIA